MTYATGETPQIGDVVSLRLMQCRVIAVLKTMIKTRVLRVGEAKASGLVTDKPERFNLVRRAGRNEGNSDE